MVSSALPAAPHGHSRRLLHHGPLLDPLHKSAAPVALPAPALRPSSSTSSFDANVIMILAIVLCVFICAVVVSVVVRCVLRVARWAWLEPRACASGCSAAASLATREEALTAVSGPILYASEAGVGSECAICLSEFAPGDSVRVLPNCNHGFHVQCIDRWLASRLSCPTCRRCLFDTCRVVSDDCT